MKSSRSKRSDLNSFSEDDPSVPPSLEPTPKGYSGFSAFFGRNKRSKSPVSIPNISAPVVDSERNAAVFERKSRRISLTSNHYKSMSRSMNDLGAMLTRHDSTEFAYSNLQTSQLPITSGVVPTSMSPQVFSPSQQSLTKRDEILPFPADNIIRQGWLNKRGSKKEPSMKLYRVYVRTVCQYGSLQTNMLLVARGKIVRIQASFGSTY